MDSAGSRHRAKQALFYAIVFLAFGAVAELISAYAYWVRRGPDSPTFASVFVVQKAIEHLRIWRNGGVSVIRSSTPAPLFVADSLLGYTIKPGVYTVTVGYQERRLVFTATVNADSTRATSRGPSVNKGRPILIFGDSELWGWVNDDFTSFPWILQTLRPEYRIVNYAQNGYGNLHELLQMESHRAVVDSAALVVVLFGDYLEERNLPSPSRLQEFTAFYVDSSSEGNFRRMTHPTAQIGADGELHVGYVPLLCDDSNAWCKRPEPPGEEVHRVTIKILERMRRLRAGPMLVAYNSGPDSSDILTAARRLGIGICDIRPNPDLDEQDSREPFDNHPGPLTMSKYAEKMAACIPRALGSAHAAAFK